MSSSQAYVRLRVLIESDRQAIPDKHFKFIASDHHTLSDVLAYIANRFGVELQKFVAGACYLNEEGKLDTMIKSIRIQVKNGEFIGIELREMKEQHVIFFTVCRPR